MTPRPTERNRLDEEESPYLRQHADNPVNWQPWDEDALAAAAEHDVPIFLSIGYAACHWCHVMADESFDDEEVATVLNDHFVPIKVDREERPDIDTIYMTICQSVTGRGGWPLSAWLTPNGEPFYVGTYFPKHGQRGSPGFLDLCESIATAWREDRADLEERATEWTESIDAQLATTPDPADRSLPQADLLSRAAEAALRVADRKYGGFGTSGPKFPQPPRLALLARAAVRTDRDTHLAVLTETLDAMATGGLYDHVGGGFHRYCVDRDWTVPHFEKMLYDNALLPRIYLAGFQLTGNQRYTRVVEETLAFVDRELSHPDGGFYSTLDAQSPDEGGERAEGAFYVWTPASLEAAVEDPETAALLTDRYGVTEAGNFEGETVLTIDATVEELAATHDLSTAAVEDRLEAGRTELFETRSERPRPPRDEKVLAGWNGLMITAFAEAGMVLGKDKYTERATTALEFVRETLWTDRLSRRVADDVVAIDGYLEDYAFLAQAALRCHEATGDVSHLAFARELADAIQSLFWDESAGTYYFTPADGEDLVSRPQEIGDGPTPAATGTTALVLLALDGFTGTDLSSPVETLLETHGETLETAPLEHATLCRAADRHARGCSVLTIAAESIPRSWREALTASYRPDLLLARRPPDAAGLEPWLETLGTDEVPPIWADRTARNGEPTVYACQDRTCSEPLHDIDDALAWLDGGQSPF